MLVTGSSVVTATSLTVTGNNGYGVGGGIAVLGTSTLDVTDSTISHNQTSGAIDDYYHHGGGLYVGADAVVSLTDTDVTANFTGAVGVGGQIANVGQLTIAGGSVMGTAGSSFEAYAAGGIFNDLDATLTMTNSVLGDNTALRGGGLFNLGRAERRRNFDHRQQRRLRRRSVQRLRRGAHPSRRVGRYQQCRHGRRSQ